MALRCLSNVTAVSSLEKVGLAGRFLFFFVDLIWTLLTKPDQRLFATIMLGGTVLVTIALAAAYWLIRDSIGLGTTIVYAFGAYFVLSIVRWFRRHTASYYTALETEQQSAASSHIDPDKSN